jgi:hypothetical protein
MRRRANGALNLYQHEKPVLAIRKESIIITLTTYRLIIEVTETLKEVAKQHRILGALAKRVFARPLIIPVAEIANATITKRGACRIRRKRTLPSQITLDLGSETSRQLAEELSRLLAEKTNC